MPSFDSRLVYEQLVTTKVVDVNVSGNVPASSIGVWSSPWYTMEQIGSNIRSIVLVPGLTYAPNLPEDSTFQVPCQLIYDNSTFLTCYPKVEVSGNQYRVTIDMFNNYSTPVASPNRIFTFTIREYLPPPIT